MLDTAGVQNPGQGPAAQDQERYCPRGDSLMPRKEHGGCSRRLVPTPLPRGAASVHEARTGCRLRPERGELDSPRLACPYCGHNRPDLPCDHFIPHLLLLGWFLLGSA